MIKNTQFKILIAVLAFVAVNFVARKLFLRLDLTANHEYTLSQATRDVVRGLNDKMKIKAYFSDDIPIDIAKTREDFRNMLSEYANLAKGNLEFEFISPNESPEKEQEAMQQGIQPVMINVREKDQAKQLKAFLGATLEYNNKKEIIPLIQPGTAMEYALTTNIKKLSATNKAKIGFIQGHREASLQEMAQVYESLDILYDVQSVYITDTTRLSDFRTLVMIRPEDTISPAHWGKIDEYLHNGGNLIIGLNEIDYELQSGASSVNHSWTDRWLQTHGVTVDTALVRDVACGSVQVQQQNGFFTFNTPVQLPYLPLIQRFPLHPVTKGLERVILQFASPVLFQGLPGTKFTPLVYTSDHSATDKFPINIDIQKRWTEGEFTEKNICVGGLLEKADGATGGKLIIFGDGDFPVGRGRNQQINEDNVSLLVNAVDFLSDDTGLIELRTKAVLTRPIKELDESSRTSIKYLNFLLPIGLVLGYAFFRNSANRRKRIQRMEERYN
ncbi:MAG: Gldg family protein [Saprospiraceae bacterium]|nr:Gldg family protein [Saprospiraceae bacterium]HMX88830.1 Gldg family protein [Saprospiraceae bacterium]HMZ39306.1 Gldg family protein [Saprospiraceae bacterium]HNA65698.1 Gldg family protein [Saprospiraceae bacterium]HNB31942.1 Gldg family protein [Saprospiraceae bacterium]